jgi:MFS family permease
MLSRPFVCLYIAVFVATMGISMVSPLLPVYARDLGATGVMLGLTFSVFAVVQTVVGPFAGQLSDRYGRKPFIMLGLVVYMIAALGYLTAHSVVQIIAFRAFSGLGTSFIFSVARAYIGDLTPRGHEGRWFGVFATADIAAFGTGPLIAGIFREAIGFKSVFVTMAALMAASVVIIAVWLPWRARKEDRLPGVDEETPSIGFVAALRDRLVLAPTIHMALFSLSIGASMSFLALRLDQDLHTGPILIGVAFAVQNLSSGFAQPLLGRIADQRDRRVMVALGLLGNGVFLALLGFVGSFALALVALMLMGVATALAQVSAGAIQVVSGRRAGMGTVLGLGSAANGLGIVLGSVLGGLLDDQFDIAAVFLFGGAVMVAGSGVFLLLTRGLETRDLSGSPPLRPEPVADAVRA